jgi:uncharacterized beta-barrel protein YwiB (DUF1934 family)
MDKLFRSDTGRPALISVIGHQTEPYDDQVEFITDGLFSRQGDDFIISYQESTLTGMDGTLTTLHIEPSRVTLIRTGDVGGTTLVFEQGRKHHSPYDIPMGTVNIAVAARKVGIALGDHGGEVAVEYAVEVDHAVAMETSLRVKVSCRGEHYMM